MSFTFSTLAFWCLLHLTCASFSSSNGYRRQRTPVPVRIRREIRDLSADEWQTIVDAMQIMKHTSADDGRILYGDRFSSYDSLVCKHALATMSPEYGDTAHVGPQFNVFHRAFTLLFEQSLMAINPDIESLPYWDFRRDDLQNLQDSIIFSDQYFGDLVGDSNQGFIVTNGQFAHWRVNAIPESLGCGAPSYHNGYNQLRFPMSVTNAEYVTRMGGLLCDLPFVIADQTVYDTCLQDMEDYTDFFWCYNRVIHAAGHLGIGGTRKMEGNVNQVSVNAIPACFSWHLPSSTMVNGIRHWAYNYGCFECPDSCSESSSSYDCLCHKNQTTSGQCLIADVAFSVPGERAEQYLFGDYIDIATSPNDPIFMFQHSNLDRYLMEWQLRHYREQQPYYHYPDSGYGYGANLDDVLSPNSPFSNLFGDGANAAHDDKDKSYTIRDIWDHTKLIGGPYTYDTVFDSIRNDTQLCITMGNCVPRKRFPVRRENNKKKKWFPIRWKQKWHSSSSSSSSDSIDDSEHYNQRKHGWHRHSRHNH